MKEIWKFTNEEKEVNRKFFFDSFTTNERKKEVISKCLTEEEKKYIKEVCRPFHDRVISIEKRGNDDCQWTMEKIMIRYKNEKVDGFRYSEWQELMCLPYFKRGTKFKGLPHQLFCNIYDFTLENLGITYDDEVSKGE